VYTSIDAVTDPELVEQLYTDDPARALNVVRTDGGELVRVAVPVVYHDPAAEVLVLVLSDAHRHRELDERIKLLVEYVRTATRDGEPLKDDPVVRQRIARLVTEGEVARLLGLRFVHESMRSVDPPRAEASEYKLYATELSKRVADASMDIAGPGSQLRVGTEEAPMAGRAESTYRYTVIDTIGGGTSEVQKNIIATRKLGLPRNF